MDSGTGYTYYGYTQVLSGGQETTELCDGMTLKEMIGDEFLSITDLGVGGTGYFFPTKEYGSTIDDVWDAVKNGICWRRYDEAFHENCVGRDAERSGSD